LVPIQGVEEAEGKSFDDKSNIQQLMIVKESIKLIEDAPKNEKKLKQMSTHSSQSFHKSDEKLPKRNFTSTIVSPGVSNRKSPSRKLSRLTSKMTSRMSSISKKKAGGKGKLNEVSKTLKQNSLNITEMLADLMQIKDTEENRIFTFESIQNTMKVFQNQYSEWVKQNHETNMKMTDVQRIHDNTLTLLLDKHFELKGLFDRTMIQVTKFRDQYTKGFKRIFNCEVTLKDLNQKHLLIDMKVKSFISKNNMSENPQLIMKKVDNQFDILYQRITSAANEQSNFNMTMQDKHEKLTKPTQAQINRMSHESSMIKKELLRTQKNNRHLMSELNGIKGSQSPSLASNQIYRSNNITLKPKDTQRKASLSLCNVSLRKFNFSTTTKNRQKPIFVGQESNHLNSSRVSADEGPSFHIQTGRNTSRLQRFNFDDPSSK
jgi:hypothetical protein